jgi:hypothetical protein
VSLNKVGFALSCSIDFPSFGRRGAAKRRGGSASMLLCALVSTPAFAATSPSAKTPLRQFLAQKTPLQIQNQSQTEFSFSSGDWHGTHWTNRVRVFQPRRNLFPGTATLLFLMDPFVWDGAGGQIAADETGTTFVMVYDVPNQPLFRRREDGLLGYSVQMMARTGDPTWSLAFPMTRSTVRSMDAVQAWSQKSPVPIRKFVLIGFSKRGLSAWLAAPDPRVKALVSLGYNNLNLPGQAQLQRRNWGALSTHWTQMIGTDFERQLETPSGQQLTRTWDPFSFRDEIQIPKLLVDATNNDYWSLDSPSQFADALKGQTNWLYFANSGHYMERSVLPMVQTSGAWIRRTLRGQSISNPTLSTSPSRFDLRAPGATSATLFYATSQNRDFRRASWSQMPMGQNGSSWSAAPPLVPSSARFLAVFGSSDYPANAEAGAMQLSSRVAIVPLWAR